MNTTITRVKTVILNASRLSYIRAQNKKIVPPQYIPPLASNTVPFIGLAPASTPPEEWMASARKEEIHFIDAYLVVFLMGGGEAVLIGGGGKKGILEMIDDFKLSIRGNTLNADDGTPYLKKPIAIAGIGYSTAPYDENPYMIVATVTIACTKLLTL